MIVKLGKSRLNRAFRNLSDNEGNPINVGLGVFNTNNIVYKGTILTLYEGKLVHQLPLIKSQHLTQVRKGSKKTGSSALYRDGITKPEKGKGIGSFVNWYVISLHILPVYPILID